MNKQKPQSPYTAKMRLRASSSCGRAAWTQGNEAFLHIKSMPDTRLINETDDYQVFQISETYPDEVHFFDQDMKEMDERKQQTAKILSEVRYFYFIDKYGLQWEFEQGHTDIGD